MVNETSANDKLTIPLDYAMEKTKEAGKFNITTTVAYLLVIVVVGVSLVFKNSVGSISTSSTKTLSFLALVALFFGYSIIRSNRINQKISDFYAQQAVPSLILDSSGISCPIVLLLLKDQNFLLNKSSTTVEIKWSDIKNGVLAIYTRVFPADIGGNLLLKKIPQRPEACI